VAIKHGILALLGDGPSHGYQLKADFEARTGDAWLVNVGQIYTTLQRLERDGLVEPMGEPDDERRLYRLTQEGEAALEDWFETPVVTDPPPRDELAIKVLLAIAADHVDVSEVLQRQRRASLEQLQEYTRLKAQADPQEQLAWLLLLDSLILKTEAEVRWLDTCDARLRQRGQIDAGVEGAGAPLLAPGGSR
jgi:DNA-binding PadR family transcriptional regulator